MSKIKVIIIGAGAIAKEHLKCLKRLSNVEIVGVCDISAAKAEAFAERFEIKRFSTNYETLVHEVRPRIAHVTTPPDFHFDITKTLLNSGISAIVEKPITRSYPEFQTLKRLAENKGLILLENHNYVFNSPVSKVLKMIQEGTFGDVKHVSINLSVDYVLPPLKDPIPPTRIVEEFITHLASLSYSFAGKHENIFTSWKKTEHTKSCYDEFSALIETKTATVSIYLSTTTKPDGFLVEVYGTKMKASMNLFESYLFLEKERRLPRPLSHFVNGLDRAKSAFSSSLGSLWSKLKGEPKGYLGLKIFLEKTYESIEKSSYLPISSEQLDEVNKLTADIMKNV